MPARGLARMPRAFAALAVLALTVSLAACSPTKPPLVPSDANAEPTVVVRVVDNAYVPEVVEIEAGQVVRWVFEGPGEHDVVAADGSFVSELRADGDYTIVFDEAGEFAYDCSIHPEMTGAVIVR